MDKRNPTALASGEAGEGGINPEAAGKPRNSSGSLSPAAKILQSELKLRLLGQCMYRIAVSLGDEQAAERLLQAFGGYQCKLARDWGDRNGAP